MRMRMRMRMRMTTLDRPLYQGDLHDTVVEGAEQEQGRHQESPHVEDVHAALGGGHGESAHRHADPDAQHDEAEDEEDDRPASTCVKNVSFKVFRAAVCYMTW